MTNKNMMKVSGYKSLAMLLWMSTTITSLAQTPDMYPPPVPEPVDKNPLNIALYIVFPVILILIFLWYRNRIKKKNKKD